MFARHSFLSLHPARGLAHSVPFSFPALYHVLSSLRLFSSSILLVSPNNKKKGQGQAEEKVAKCKPSSTRTVYSSGRGLQKPRSGKGEAVDPRDKPRTRLTRSTIKQTHRQLRREKGRLLPPFGLRERAWVFCALD